MKALVMFLGGPVEFLIEKVLDKYPIEDWEYFLAGFSDLINTGDDDEEWREFVRDNSTYYRLLENLLRKYEGMIDEYIHRIKNRHSVYEQSRLIFETTIMPDPTTGTYLLSVKSMLRVEEFGSIDAYLLN